MPNMPSGYYDRFDPSKNYDKHLFISGRVLQSAELNELQSESHNRLQRIADAILNDGDIISGASVAVNATTGVTACSGGAIYVRGAVRGLPAKSLTVATSGSVLIGVYYKERVVTELDDGSLRDPAVGVRNYQEPGAVRLEATIQWGFFGDGTEGDFYPIWTVVDGVVLPKEAPPNLDAVSNAIASYDVQSTGGTYVSSGLNVSALADDASGNQVYSVGEGDARINGRFVKLSTSRRNVYTTAPDLRRITSEPVVSAGTSAQTITVNRPPIANLVSVQITAQKSATVTHGAYTGALDALPDNSVLSIVSVTQGATTFIAGTDFKLTSGSVDWSLPGAEPSPGSTYSVTYQYITTATPTNANQTSFSVTGAVAGTLILTTYDSALPRFDRLCLDSNGNLVWVNGVSADYYPVAPTVPKNLLLLATISQTWFTNTTRPVSNDGVRVVPMSDIESLKSSITNLYTIIASQQLKIDANSRTSSATKGLFVDSFSDNSQRDAGITQNAVTVLGVMTLPMTETVLRFNSGTSLATILPFTETVNMSQTMRTGSLKINPYMSFEPIPAKVTLSPAADHHVTQVTNWAPSMILWRITGSGNLSQTFVASRGVAVVSTTTDRLPTIFPISVGFNLNGFGPGETLTKVTFDGVDVTSTVVGV